MARQFAGIGAGAAGVDPGSAACVINQAAWSVCGWFMTPSNVGGSDFAQLYGEGGAASSLLTVQLKTAGIVRFFTRNDANSANLTIDSGSMVDSLWHWFAFIKRSTNDYEVFLDGASIGTSGNSVAASAGQGFCRIGNPAGTGVLPNGARLGRMMTFTSALPLGAAQSAVYGMLPTTPNLWLELTGDSPEPDWSGNQRNGTVTGTTFAAGPPVPPLFPQRYTPYVVAAVAGQPPRSMHQFRQRRA